MKLQYLLTAGALWLCGVTAKAAVTEREAVASVLVLEAGGTGTEGMRAVMWVIRNRTLSRNQSAYEVVTARHQFSVMRQGTFSAVRRAKRHPRWSEALSIYDAYHGGLSFNHRTWDPTQGATHFESFRSQKPYWTRSMTLTAFIGGNHFYAPRKRS